MKLGFLVTLFTSALIITQAAAGNDADGRQVRVGDSVYTQHVGCVDKADIITMNEMIGALSISSPSAVSDAIKIRKFGEDHCGKLFRGALYRVKLVDEDAHPYPLACIHTDGMYPECVWTNQIALTHRIIK